MGLTAEQTKLIKASIPALQAHGNTITSLFYANLLRDYPSLNDVFNTANQENNHQAAALAGSLAAYATHIDDLGVLAPEVEKICAKHASLYIKAEQYDLVGEYLLKAMGDVLGAALTPDLLAAWGEAYWQLAHLMINREKEILDSNEGWVDWRECRIVEKVKESSEIMSLRLVPVEKDGKKMDMPFFKPGQYISIMTSVPALHHLQARQYSLSCAPNEAKEKGYRISVKRELGVSAKDLEPAHPGYLSTVLHDTKQVGDILLVSHPQGTFYLDPPSSNHDANGPVVLISAGVGVTPMISMLDTLFPANDKPSPSKQKITWIHAARSTSAQAFGAHVAALANRHDNIKRFVFVKTPSATYAEDKDKGRSYTHTGRMDLNLLDGERDLHLRDERAQYYICGPESFMLDTARWLRDEGVGEERVKLELFGTGGVPSS